MKLNPCKVFSLGVHKNNKQTNRFMISQELCIQVVFVHTSLKVVWYVTLIFYIPNYDNNYTHLLKYTFCFKAVPRWSKFDDFINQNSLSLAQLDQNLKSHQKYAIPNMHIILHSNYLHLTRAISSHGFGSYSNTGCGVFKRGVQN